MCGHWFHLLRSCHKSDAVLSSRSKSLKVSKLPPQHLRSNDGTVNAGAQGGMVKAHLPASLRGHEPLCVEETPTSGDTSMGEVEM